MQAGEECFEVAAELQRGPASQLVACVQQAAHDMHTNKVGWLVESGAPYTLPRSRHDVCACEVVKEEGET
jgi:hypothetical protein